MDDLDEVFADLYYPGSRQMRPPAPLREETEDDAWDSRPHVKHLKGKEVEFFTIEALCKAFGNRAPVTVRLWMRNGYIPEATYRLPDTTVGERTTRGRRLFTRGQVEALLRIAQQHGILDARRIEWSKHPTFGDEVAVAWTELPTA